MRGTPEPEEFSGKVTEPVRALGQEQSSGLDHPARVQGPGDLVALGTARDGNWYTLRVFRPQ